MKSCLRYYIESMSVGMIVVICGVVLGYIQTHGNQSSGNIEGIYLRTILNHNYYRGKINKKSLYHTSEIISVHLRQSFQASLPGPKIV